MIVCATNNVFCSCFKDRAFFLINRSAFCQNFLIVFCADTRAHFSGAMKVVLTGGSGFIAGHLLEQLQNGNLPPPLKALREIHTVDRRPEPSEILGARAKRRRRRRRCLQSAAPLTCRQTTMARPGYTPLHRLERRGRVARRSRRGVGRLSPCAKALSMRRARRCPHRRRL